MNYNSEYAVILDMMKYLDDDVVRSLIGFIFNKEQFYNPYSTSKELFLSILVDFGTRHSINVLNLKEVLDDKKNYQQSNYSRIGNSYLTLINSFRNEKCITIKNQRFSYKEDYIEDIKKENLELMVNLYNNLFITINPNDKLLKSKLYGIIKNIANSIASFNVGISENSKLIKFYNEFISQYIKTERCYIIDLKYPTPSLKVEYFYTNEKNEKYNRVNSFNIITKENRLYLSCNHFLQEIKHYTTIENSNDNNGHALIGAKTVSSYFNSIKSLDIAVEKLQEKIAKQESCHICNPVVKNNKYKKKHMCSNCQKLVNLIIENVKESGGWTTQADIVYAIKQKGKEEETCQNTYEIRKLRYKNLRDYLTELNKDKKLNKKKIEDLVNTIFKEKDGFEKFSF